MCGKVKKLAAHPTNKLLFFCNNRKEVKWRRAGSDNGFTGSPAHNGQLWGGGGMEGVGGVGRGCLQRAPLFKAGCPFSSIMPGEGISPVLEVGQKFYQLELYLQLHASDIKCSFSSRSFGLSTPSAFKLECRSFCRVENMKQIIHTN